MDTKDMITIEECKRQVGLMARRTALLHYFFSKTIISRLGEEEGKKLISEAIWAYGNYCGTSVRKKVEELGLPLTEENFDKVPDLPEYGWDTEMIALKKENCGPSLRIVPLLQALRN